MPRRDAMFFSAKVFEVLNGSSDCISWKYREREREREFGVCGFRAQTRTTQTQTNELPFISYHLSLSWESVGLPFFSSWFFSLQSVLLVFKNGLDRFRFKSYWYQLMVKYLSFTNFLSKEIKTEIVQKTKRHWSNSSDWYKFFFFVSCYY